MTSVSGERPRASIAGKVAAVTGAGQGNGRAIALRLARGGASIFASDIQPQTLAELEAELGRLGVKCATGIYDAASVADAARFVDDVVATFGRIDIAVNNAGAIRPEPFPNVSEETWDWNVNLNMKGLYFYMQEEAKQMMRQRSGRIINISSIAGLVGGQTLSPPYAASKGAVVNLTQTAAAEMAQYGVTVNAVAPGMVDTAFSWRMDEELGVKAQGLEPGEFLPTSRREHPARPSGAARGDRRRRRVSGERRCLLRHRRDPRRLRRHADALSAQLKATPTPGRCRSGRG